MRNLILVGSVFATVVAGCFRRSGHPLRIGDQVSPPQGLDSVGTARWVAQQRTACPGELRLVIDHMPMVSLDGSAAPYHSDIAAVVCARP